MAIHGFELLREQRVAELNAEAQLYRHRKTGAEVLSLQVDDPNTWFGITFRTLPGDSTGVAHILEHCVLCGSHKYPLKDAFAELAKGSLQTFLNALTFADKTVYPVASQNPQDFRNLVDVYLNAVLHPLLRREVFLQQAWHYELEHADDPLVYKGVVFNEMKGAFAVPDSQLWRFTRSALFPDTTYGAESGGDPRHIPDLTYEALVEFHRTYYHPSNARIFFYGAHDPAEQLSMLDGYLSAFEASPPQDRVELQPPFAEPRRIERSYAGPAGDGAHGKALLTVNWALDEQTDRARTLALLVLEQILIGTPTAPLRRALIESGLGEDTAGVGLSTGFRQLYFAVGLKGIAADQADAVEALVLDTLRTLVRDGVEPALVEAALNTIEFRLRENNPGDFPRGLSIMLRSLATWLHDGDPFAALQWSAPLEAIKAAARTDGRYFADLLQAALLDNPHRLTVLLRPDAELDQRQTAAERERLDRARETLSADEIDQIVATTAELKRIQATPDPAETVATLPTLKLTDLNPRHTPLPLEVVTGHAARVVRHTLPTNGIVYLDVGLELRRLPPELLRYTRIFGRALLELGTAREDDVQLSRRIGRATGGIRPDTFVDTIRATDDAAAWLFLRGKATAAQAGELIAILQDILLAPRLDNRDRLRQIVLEEKAGVEASLVPSGHQFVAGRLRAHYTMAGWAAEQIGGIDYLLSLRELAERIETDWPGVLADLEHIYRQLAARAALLLNITADDAAWQQVQEPLDALIAALPDTAAADAELPPWPERIITGNEAFTIPAQVNYVGKGADLYALGYRLSGATHAVQRFLTLGWLWDQVRVQGGAYGGFASWSPRSGIWSFTSYRDPNVAATLAIYDRTGAHLRAAELGSLSLTRSIIGAIGALDPYRLPDAQGWVALQRYLVGESDAQLQRQRDEILASASDDFRGFADALDGIAANGRTVILGSATAIEAAVADGLGGMTVRNLL